MDYIYYATDYSNSLYHHGIHGMHWGVRRFQNPDGSWTTEGLKRRRKDSENLKKSTDAYVQKAKDAASELDKFYKKLYKEHPDMTSYSSKNDKPSVWKYIDKSESELNKLEPTLGKSTVDILKQFNKLYKDFNESTIEGGEGNEEWKQYYNSSKEYIEKYGHESYQKLLGDDANLYYTENWRTGQDHLIDYDSGNFYYRNLSEELW